MTRLGLWTALGCLWAAGTALAENTSPGNSDAATQQEVARLQGTWRALRLQVDHRTVEIPSRSKKNPGVALDLHGDHFEFRGLGAEFKGHFAPMPARSPGESSSCGTTARRRSAAIGWKGTA